MIGLSQYYKVLVENGYENIDFITDITWEDLQEIGITKLGKAPRAALAVVALAVTLMACAAPRPPEEADAGGEEAGGAAARRAGQV